MTEQPRSFTAHEIAGDPELYSRVYRIGNHDDWECAGYSSKGGTVVFYRLIPGQTANPHSITVKMIYVKPERKIKEATNE